MTRPPTWQLGGLLGEPGGALRYDDAAQLARGPDVDRGAEVERPVQRAALEREGARARARVPDAGAARRAEHAVQGAAAIGLSRPGPGLAGGEAERGARDDQRDAEHRGGLLPALAAVAD